VSDYLDGTLDSETARTVVPPRVAERLTLVVTGSADMPSSDH
jgi:hypothetical protein